jgi:hypothetical protein
MTKCRKCKEIVGPSAPVYKASRGFVDENGNFHDDESVVFHIECYYSFDPFGAIEESIKTN